MKKLLFYLFLLGICVKAKAQISYSNGVFGAPVWEIHASTPPQIRFDPVIRKVLFMPVYRVDDLKVGRDKKEALIKECLETLMRKFSTDFQANFPNGEVVLINEPLEAGRYPLQPETIKSLLENNNADIIVGINDFRPWIEQESVQRTDDNNKRARYVISVEGLLQLYNKDSLLRSSPFRESMFLSERTVISGLLSAGPSLVNNREPAIEVSAFCGSQLARRFKGGDDFFRVSLFSMKEFKEINKMLLANNYSEAAAVATSLSTSNKGKIRGRAFYILAMLAHRSADFDKAYEYILEAQKEMDGGPGNAYKSYIQKFTSSNSIRWR